MVTAADISKLRAMTGVGMMDCKKALEECGGDMEKAAEYLRKKGMMKAAKLADKIAAEGTVASYIHAGGKIGVLLEVNCQTDFVALTEAFQNFVRELALHIAAARPRYLDRTEVPASVLEKEKEIYSEQLKAQGKSEAMIANILNGKLEKFYEEVCLVDQVYVKDESKKIKDLLAAMTAETGEKVTVRRFARYELGEGIAKKTQNFADEVAEQLK